MAAPGVFLSNLGRFIAFVIVFLLLLILAILKAAIIAPVVFIIVLVGNMALIIGLYPCHAVWTCYCILKTKKFGDLLKLIIMLLMPIPIVLWPIASFIGTVLTGLGFGIALPLIATFEPVREGVNDKFVRCLKDGTWGSIKGGCMIVRDFKDICFHSYFSVMDGLVEAKGETIMDIKLSQVPGCFFAGVVGVLVLVPMLTLIILYKVPVMLFKGWRQLIRDLIGRSGPFLESVCVPFAGLLILLWPIAVELTAIAGILSSISLGCYAAAVAYQENSTKSGLLYVISCISMFDEFTNDFLDMREGSCFPRPKYRKANLSRVPTLPVKRVSEQISSALKHPLIKTPSMKMQELKSVVIWDSVFKACEDLGKELVRVGAIRESDLEAWQNSKNKIVNNGLPSYVILQCLLRSIKSGSAGFVMRDNVELTSINRPEGRIFDWLFEPMLLLKEQIKAVDLEDTEEKYMCKLALYCGDTRWVTTWQNGGVPPADEVKRAQLEGLIRRLHGFSLTVSRLPTFRRRMEVVVKALLQEARKMQNSDVVEETIQPSHVEEDIEGKMQ
ncbi:hypothetical protein J5N97_024592 [Dioscorea zingiberensis]|uniref:Uncharacterized protein n=1 Tax=Dioscorea zingiberensis TaxID=325984 RepID=A0A9D5C7M5_9LILI|nr:hypothetical protein J5N97_024592 [Dioscorea zingiberensis]